MSHWEGSNRRNSVRIKYPCLVIIRTAAGKKESILCHTENVGSGGIQVVLKRDIPTGTAVDIELDLLNIGNHVKCKGEVVWIVPKSKQEKRKEIFYDVGVIFKNLNKNQALKIEKVMNRVSKN